MHYLPCLLLYCSMHALMQLREVLWKWGILVHAASPPSPHRCFSFRDESQRIADVILSRKAEFVVFTTYIGHYDRSMSLLEDSCRTSPAFAAIVDQFEVRPALFTACTHSLKLSEFFLNILNTIRARSPHAYFSLFTISTVYDKVI